MAVTTQGFSSFSADAVTYIAEKTLIIAKKAVVFQQLGEKHVLPAHNSKTFQFTRFDRLALPLTTLADGVTPDNTSMSISTVTAVADMFGAYVNLTDVANLTIKHPVMVKAIDLMGYQAAEVMDREIINMLLAGTAVNYGGAATARNGLSSTSTDVMNTALVRKVVASLRTNGAQEYDGSDYVGVVDSQVEMDLSADSTFQAAAQYSNIKVLQNGEIGRWMGVRWMRSNFIPTLSGITSTNASATGASAAGSIPAASVWFSVDYIDANTGFTVKSVVPASTYAAAASNSSGSLTVTVPSSTSFNYNVYAGSGASSLYLVNSSLLAGAASQAVTAIPSAGTLQPGIPASTKVVHFSWVFGKESFAVIDLLKLQTFITPAQASDSDPLVQRRKSGWKFMFKSVICNQDFLKRCETLSAFDA